MKSIKDRARVLVLVVGPSPGQAGGVSSVMSYLQDQIDYHRYELKFIDTLSNGRWSLIAFLFASLRVVAGLLSALCRRRSVVVHLNVASKGSTYRKWFVSRICMILSVPFICHLHGAKYRTFYANASPVVKRGVRSLFQAAANVIVLGTPWQRHVIDDLGVHASRVTVVPNGSADFLTSVKPDGRLNDVIRIAFSGRLEERKGVPELLDACDRIYKRRSGFELTLMGDSRDPSIRVEAESRPYCRVTGWLTRDELARELSSVDLFVLPSHDEGLPMAMLEAMSFGIPVVVTPVGGIPDVVRNGREGFLVGAGNVEALAEALLQLLADEGLRTRMGIQARRTWESQLTAAQMTRRIESQWDASLDFSRTTGRTR